MNKRLILLPLFCALSSVGYTQRFCADSSIRLKYTFDYPSIELFNNYDTTGFNIISGNVGGPSKGLVFFRTTWGDQILWTKKFTLPGSSNIACFNTFDAPNGTVIGTGYYAGGGQSELMLFRMDTNGVILWAKRYRLISGNTGYGSGAPVYKNVLVTNDAIYFTASFRQSVLVKVDLNGNVLWSTNLTVWPLQFSADISDAPILRNDTVFTVHHATETVTGQPENHFIILSSYKALDGSFIGSTAYKKIPDALTHGIEIKYLKLNSDNSVSLAGNVRKLFNGQSYVSEYFFHFLLSEGLSVLSANYYTSSTPVDILYKYDYNSLKQHVFMLNSSTSTDRYFISFDNDKILRSRRFSMPATGTFRGNVNLDERQNIHFGYTYRQDNQTVLEYARISDLAAGNTATCFGVDSNIVQPTTINMTESPFTWDQVNQNIVTGIAISLVEQSETISTELVCKQVSYCDSIKIIGDSTACITDQFKRYSIYLNPECLREIKWIIDTSFATLISQEADSAITISFKKTGHFYLKALVANCVIADSMGINIATPQSRLSLNKDKSEICPGDSLTLRASKNFMNYLWQDGSTRDSFVVRNPGFYKVTGTDSCGNVFRDSISINAADVTIPLFDRYTICQNDSARLYFPDNFSSITWNPNLDVVSYGNNINFFPKETTVYTIQAIKDPGCLVEKQVTIERKVCPEWVYFPSAFTPNNDGLNDIFRANVSGKLQFYSLNIYDRYGMVVFSTTDPSNGWNGNFKGAVQQNGIYVYLASYNFFNQPRQLLKGTIAIIR